MARGPTSARAPRGAVPLATGTKGFQRTFGHRGVVEIDTGERGHPSDVVAALRGVGVFVGHILSLRIVRVALTVDRGDDGVDGVSHVSP